MGFLTEVGFGLPAAVGAKVARPDDQVVLVSGDGSFMMNVQELGTLRRAQLPVKMVLLDNQRLGMVRQWQELFYEHRYSSSTLPQDCPDFVKLAEAYGCLALRVETEDQIDEAIQLALETNDRPVVIDFVVSADAMVWPMVPQGVSNSYVQYARDHAPAFDEEV